MLTEEELEGFYPRLTSRILLYLRKQRHEKEEVRTENLIRKFDKSKSIISQALSFLSKHQCIKRKYVEKVESRGARHVIKLTPKGIKVANRLIFEGLDALELKVIKSSNKKRRNKKKHIRI